MSVVNAIPLLAAAGGDYQISRSVRLRSSASAYFNRTQATPTNNKIWTWSGWVKKGLLTSDIYLFAANNSTATEFIKLSNSSSDAFEFAYWNGSAWAYQVRSTMVLRDPSAWYHIVVSVDTTQATASNRVRLYVNGVGVTSFSISSYPSQNTNTQINSAVAARLGSGFSSAYFDGYLTEVNFIDGQALTSSSFGETDAVTGVWKPKKYAGTYGTNGFYLNFSDNSAATAAAIGKDSSGNGNNWTPNNISVTAGVTYDSMLDTPTPYADGGNGRGNYAVLNPLVKTDSGSANTLSEGNLRANCTSASYGDTSFATIPVSSGKWYAEFTLSNSSYPSVEIFNMNYPPNFGSSGNGRASLSPYGYGYLYSGSKQNNASASAYGSTLASGDVVGIALDMDNGKVFFSKNGTWQASGDPAAGTNAAFTGLSGNFAIGICDSQTVSYSRANFGQRPFTYTPPTGFKALNTQNLPDATIKKGNQYFDVVTAAGASIKTTAEAVFTGDELMWIKDRANANNHQLIDTVRGTSAVLQSNTTAAETTYTAPSGNSVGWVWKESASAGFDIVTYTGNGSAQTLNHSLGVAPKMYIVKSRTDGGDAWVVYHASMPSASYYLTLNTTNAQASNSTVFNATAPTSSVFSVGSSRSTVSGNYVAYLFAEVAGFSKMGSYTGNGSADGPFIYLGFKPRFLMIKRTDTTGDWHILDTSRDTYNVAGNVLYPNLSSAESGVVWTQDILSNGFKLRITGANENASGGTYIYAAFAESPFRYSLAR